MRTSSGAFFPHFLVSPGVRPPSQRAVVQAGGGAAIGAVAAGGRDPLALHGYAGAGDLPGGLDGEEPQNQQRHPEPGLRPEAHPYPLPHVHFPEHATGTRARPLKFESMVQNSV